MTVEPLITVLYGGVGPEREVSLRTGPAIAAALENHFPVRAIETRDARLPPAPDPAEGVVYPGFHGEFGEDGALQGLLEKGGFEYCGSDSISSALCMDKAATKERALAASVPTPDSVVLEPGATADPGAIGERLGEKVVVKPVAGGSSKFLSVAEGTAELRRRLDGLPDRRWLLEKFVEGREVSVGVLNGIAQGVVEILPAGGVYDYHHKYTPGTTEYRWPAVLEPEEETAIRNNAEAMFAVCGCRDFARVDFRLDGHGPWFLEINTLPGLTAESLLPKSAACRGLCFEDLAVELVSPALNRFQRRKR